MKKEDDSKSHRGRHAQGYGSGEISIQKLIFYNILFFVPILFFLYISKILGNRTAAFLETTPSVSASLIMLAFVTFFFFFIIPFIRNRENVRGVRYALIGFLIVAVGITVPAMFIGNFSLFLLELPHIASYILLTFIYTPEVLGMDIDISKWFKHYKQLFIIFIYTSIVLGYVLGFGYMYYMMYQTSPSSFAYAVDKEAGWPTFAYYSIITFATIGYGEITPVATAARLLACIEAIISAVVNVIFIAILFVYISNFQSFLKEMAKEEKEIRKLEKMEKGLFGKGILGKRRRKGKKP